MQYIPIHTRAFVPPKDDITEVVKSTARQLRDGDILLITSKIVAISEGRCVAKGTCEKDSLIMAECEASIGRERVPGKYAILTILHHTLIPSSGIDESNGNGYYILWPKDPMQSAKNLWNIVREESGIKNIGVIVTDSHCVPMRYGVVGVSIGFYGFHPIVDLVGRPDIFGRPIKVSKQNIPDAITSGAVYMMGETSEQTPLCIARGIPNVRFTDTSTSNELLVPKEDDIYAPLYTSFDRNRGGDAPVAI